MRLSVRKTKSPSVVLAPMAGITDSPTRVISGEMGADLCFTEMVSAAGMVHDRLRSGQLLEKLPYESEPVAHIYGGDADIMAEAACIISECGGYAGIDINAGCPVRKVVKGGGGTALMKDISNLAKIVSATVAQTNLPVTLKTRIGLHPEEVCIFDIIRAVEDAGGAGIAIHGRFASSRHQGEVNIQLLREAVEKSSIPIIVNGGIKSASDALRLLNETGAAGVMIGRGAIGNPWIFSEIHDALNGAELSGSPVRHILEVLEKLKRHFEMALEFKHLLKTKYPDRLCTDKDPELSTVHNFRHYMFNYFKGRPGSLELRRRMDRYTSIADIMHAIEEFIIAKT